MSTYHLDTVAPKLLSFLEELTNWYVRLNRPRIKGESGNDDWIQSLNILFDVLFKLSILLSPFVPFITDNIY
jgi:isoleucyl-tRNA synthetase